MHTLHVIHKKNWIKQSKQLCCNKNSHPTRQWCKWSKKTRFNNKIIYYLRRFILNSEDFSTDENKSSGFNTQCELTTAFSEWNSEINICDLCMHFIWLRLSTYFQWPPIRLFRFLINKKFHTKTKHQQKLNELKKKGTDSAAWLENAELSTNTAPWHDEQHARTKWICCSS